MHSAAESAAAVAVAAASSAEVVRVRVEVIATAIWVCPSSLDELRDCVLNKSLSVCLSVESESESES